MSRSSWMERDPREKRSLGYWMLGAGCIAVGIAVDIAERTVVQQVLGRSLQSLGRRRAKSGGSLAL